MVVITPCEVHILAIISGRRGDAAQTWQHLRTALHARPESAQIHLQIGLTYLDTSRPGWSLEAAAAHLLLVGVFMPENDMAHQVFGLVMAERGRYALAYPSPAEALRLNPRNSEAKQASARLRSMLGPEARETAPKVTLKRYPSGAPRQIVQVEPDATGHHVPEGILTEWHENGELERFLDYAGGVPHGVEVRWDRSGEVVLRVE
jgi:tetratricopeptide (TPR) repeat protein